MPCTYILFSKKVNKFYVGSSKDNTPHSRLDCHNRGKTKSTKSGKPWILVYYESYATYAEAREKELFLKTGKGREWIYQKFGNLKSK